VLKALLNVFRHYQFICSETKVILGSREFSRLVSSAILLQNYVMHRYDRSNIIEGGVLVYIHKSQKFASCTPLNDLNIHECTIHLRIDDKIFISSIVH